MNKLFYCPYCCLYTVLVDTRDRVTSKLSFIKLSLTHLPEFFILHSPSLVVLFCPEGLFSSLYLMSVSFSSHGAISGSGLVLWKGTTDHPNPINVGEASGANSKPVEALLALLSSLKTMNWITDIRKAVPLWLTNG